MPESNIFYGGGVGVRGSLLIYDKFHFCDALHSEVLWDHIIISAEDPAPIQVNVAEVDKVPPSSQSDSLFLRSAEE